MLRTAREKRAKEFWCFSSRICLAFRQMTQICQYPKPCDAATEALGAGNDTKALVRVTVLAVHGLCV